MLTNSFTFLTLTGFSARIIQYALILCTLLFSSLAFSNDISGIWKHAKSPAWIEVRQETGIATVVRNDKFPERVGREILKTIKTANPQQSLWHGLFYVEKLGGYKRVEISFPDADRMLITAKKGLFSHTVEWFRVNSKAIH